MNISAPFIARPIATWLLAIAILLAGALGYRALPVSALPEVDFPTIQVTANKDAPTQVIFVSGEVKTPSRITMSPGMTVGGSITAAGGFTDFASPKKVKLIRAGKAQELDCRKADSPSSLTHVQPGDTIVVPQ